LLSVSDDSSVESVEYLMNINLVLDVAVPIFESNGTLRLKISGHALAAEHYWRI
jgi:hypothetical protein